MKKKISLMQLIVLTVAIALIVCMAGVAYASDGTESPAPMIDLTQIIIALVELVFSAVIVPLTAPAFKWLKGRTQNESLKAALDEAETVADNTVASLQASVVDELKAKSSDGKLSMDEGKRVMESAIKMFCADISTGSLDVLKHNADDIAAYIKNLIEARLAASKKG